MAKLSWRLVRVFTLAIALANALSHVCTPARAASDADPVPSWYARGVKAALLDPMDGVPAATLSLSQADEALRLVTQDDPKARDAVTNALVVRLGDTNFLVGQAAAMALGQIKQDDPKARDAVTNALVARLGDANNNIRQAAAMALGQIAQDDPKARDAVTNALVARLGDTNDNIRQAAATALGQIKQDDPKARDAVTNALVARLGDANFFVGQAAATALGQIKQDDPKARDAVTNALVARLGDANSFVGQAAATALGQIKQDDPKARDAVTNALVARLGDAKSFVGQAAATALGQIKQDDPKARDAVTNALVARLGDANDIIRQAAAMALGQIAQDDPKARDAVTNALVARLGDTNDNIRQTAATALGQIKQDDPKARDAVTNALVARVGDANDNIRRAAVTALGQIAQDDPKARDAVTNALVARLGDADVFVGQAAATALGQIKQDDPKARDAVTNALVARLGDANFFVGRAAATALGQIKQDDPKARDAVTNALVARLGDANFFVGQAAATALGQIKQDDPKARDAVTNALVARLGDVNDNMRQAAAMALGQIKQDDPKARDAVINALVARLGDTNSDVRQAATRTLVQFGQLTGPKVLLALELKTLSGADAAAIWRASTIALSGAPDKPSDAWTYLTFLGGLPAGDNSWPGPSEKASVALPVLRAVASGRDTIRKSTALAQEAANVVLEVFNHACPEAARTDDDPWLATAGHFIWSEAASTFAVFERGLGLRAASATDGRCWPPEGYTLLTTLRADMATMSATKPQADVLGRYLKNERAPPVFGLLTTGAMGWAVFWLGLILAFPYNARIRSIYLYNEKLRGVLSLWFVPLLLTLLPFLRKLLLRPFRGRLLADARLGDFDRTAWHPNVHVSDGKGTTSEIAATLAAIRGNILLIGESGLGKTTFLRLLASQTRQIVVFLNARGCEKGVIEAIRRKTSEVQGDGFFKSLIETRDLAVIIDAFNEVNADIRLRIVTFVNEFPKADILVATQPIEWIGTSRSPFEAARALYLQPLAEAEITGFLLSRPVRHSPQALVSGDAYDTAVRCFIAERLDGAPSDEARGAARIALSNPANLTYAADLLSRGRIPFPDDLIGQAFALACGAYREVYLRDFPRKSFAARVTDLRRQDINYLINDDFPDELATLVEYKLLVNRPMHGKDEKNLQAAFFRHDTIVDYFMYIAFTDNDTLQTEYLDDPRFRGVYLLFADKAPSQRARLLRDLLVTSAAESGDHNLSDEYVRRLNARDPQNLRADLASLAAD